MRARRFRSLVVTVAVTLTLLLAFLFALQAPGPAPAPTATPPKGVLGTATVTADANAVASADGDPISRMEWQKAVAIDRAMSQLAGQTAPNAKSPWMVLLGVDLKENVETIQNFTTQFGLTYPLLLDRDGAVSEHYQVRGIPTTVFLDADGVVRARHVGPLTEDKFAEGS